jgi:DNA polymerase III sliding clamp (beta) subunit (PCNA family)
LKFNIKVGEFVDQISQAAITTDPKSLDQPNSKVFLRALQSANGSALYFFSTNQQSKTFVKSVAEVVEPGETLVDAGRLLGGLQGRDGDLMMNFETVQPSGSSTESKIVVKIGRNKFQLPLPTGVEKLSKDSENLPFRVPANTKIAASLLLEFIRRTQFCIPSSGNGQMKVPIDTLHLKKDGALFHGQATDGNIFSLHHGPASEDVLETKLASVLIPQEALNPLQKLLAKYKDQIVDLVTLSPSLGMTPHEMFFRMPGVLFGTTLRPGKYPPMAMLAEQHLPTFQVKTSRDDLKSTIGRASNFVMEPGRDLQVIFSDKQEVAEDEPMSYQVNAGIAPADINEVLNFEIESGTAIKAKMNIGLDYLGNVVGALRSDTVILGINSSRAKALIVRDEDRDDDDKLIISSMYAISQVQEKKA